MQLVDVLRHLFVQIAGTGQWLRFIGLEGELQGFYWDTPKVIKSRADLSDARRRLLLCQRLRIRIETRF